MGLMKRMSALSTVAIGVAFFASVAVFVRAQSLDRVRVLLKDGRNLTGTNAQMHAIDEGMEIKGTVRAHTILVVDDGLRKTFVPKYRVAQSAPEAGEQLQRYKIPQRGIADIGAVIGTLGDYNTSTRFDEYGRRLISLRTPGGSTDIIQAITEINPRYIRVQGMNRIHDMRIATNAVPREVLTPVILSQIDDRANVEDRMGLVRFYIQSNLYPAAVDEIADILQEFQGDAEVAKRLAQSLARVRTLEAEQKIKELELRFQAGQYALVKRLLTSFDPDDTPVLIMQEARRMLGRYEEFERRKSLILKRFDELAAGGEIDGAAKEKLVLIRTEIERELNFNTIDRFAMFELHRNNANYDNTQKLAFAVAGWFVGSNTETTRLSTAMALFDMRELIIRYLVETNATRRQGILEDLKKIEANSPELVAKALAYIKPPRAPEAVSPPQNAAPGISSDGTGGTNALREQIRGRNRAANPEPTEAKRDPVESALLPGKTRTASLRPSGGERYAESGFYELERTGFVEDPFYKTYKYWVQLPPEYDPNRRYPAIITLNGATTTPLQQIDWWAGEWRGRERFGQATRHGYIVIAPLWNPAMLLEYDFSGMSHGAVLFTYRDALQRFNIDTDRVFLSGHGIGGSAAWDIAASHPDTWAGVICIGAPAGKYINAYTENMRMLPFYYVGGELEGAMMRPMLEFNALVFNKYLQPMASPFEATVVLYKGRGSESYSDEQLRLFDWMKRHPRNPVPDVFSVRTMRPWDNYFWWLELGDMTRDRKFRELVIDPIYWPEKDSGSNAPKTIRVESKIARNANAVRVTLAPGSDPEGENAGPVVFLSPNMVDFNSKVEVMVNSQPYHPVNGLIEPSVEDLLEDARTRCDRLHPFWVRLESRKRQEAAARKSRSER